MPVVIYLKGRARVGVTSNPLARTLNVGLRRGDGFDFGRLEVILDFVVNR